MEPSLQAETTKFYSELLESRALFYQVKQIEFSTQPKTVIYREKKLLLYHYRPKVKKPYATPLLIVFALINRPEILDLSPNCSFISSLLAAGRDVYLIDWGYPTAEDQNLSLEDYILHYLRHCVEKVKQTSYQKRIDLLGICQGGVFSLSYASLFPQDLRFLILISTPVDFQTPTDLVSRFAQKTPIDHLVSQVGNIPGTWLTQFFLALRPFHLIGKKYLTLLDYYSPEKSKASWLQQFFLMERWLWDNPDQAGRAFAQFIKNFYQQNNLLHNQFYLDKYQLHLQSITMPILNIIARDDYIVPPAASRILSKCVQSESYSLSVLPTGHIGIYVSQKTRKHLPKLISSWLKKMELRC